MTPDEQLELWLKGESIHNHERWYDVVDDKGIIVSRKRMEGGECCPDFSCCNGGIMVDKEIREVFVAASKTRNEAVTMRMLMQFLAGAFPQAHVAGLEASRREGGGVRRDSCEAHEPGGAVMITQQCQDCEESKRIRGEIATYDHQRDNEKVLGLQAELRKVCRNCELGKVEG